MRCKRCGHVDIPTEYFENEPWEDHYVWFPSKIRGKWCWRETVQRQLRLVWWSLEFGFTPVFNWRLK